MIYLSIIEKEIMFKVVFLYVTLKAYNSLCLLLLQKLENVTLGIICTVNEIVV
jgi:uncharacterized membrane protein (DUF485 family)